LYTSPVPRTMLKVHKQVRLLQLTHNSI